MKTVVRVELDSTELRNVVIEAAKKQAGEKAGSAKVEFLIGVEPDGDANKKVIGATVEFQACGQGKV